MPPSHPGGVTCGQAGMSAVKRTSPGVSSTPRIFAVTCQDRTSGLPPTTSMALGSIASALMASPLSLVLRAPNVLQPERLPFPELTPAAAERNKNSEMSSSQPVKPTLDQIVGVLLDRVGRGVIEDVRAMLTAAPR